MNLQSSFHEIVSEYCDQPVEVGVLKLAQLLRLWNCPSYSGCIFWISRWLVNIRRYILKIWSNDLSVDIFELWILWFSILDVATRHVEIPNQGIFSSIDTRVDERRRTWSERWIQSPRFFTLLLLLVLLEQQHFQNLCSSYSSLACFLPSATKWELYWIRRLRGTGVVILYSDHVPVVNLLQ